MYTHMCLMTPFVVTLPADTLSCYPFKDTDPFIVPDTRVPAVMFAGNQVSDGHAAAVVNVLCSCSFAALVIFSVRDKRWLSHSI